MQDSTKRSRRATIQRISVPKPQVVLASHLRDRILCGAIPEGESLPSERDLVEQTGLSRGAVREALRTLAVEGLVQTRHGRFGGSVVTLPGLESTSIAIHRFVQGRRLPVSALQETRELLEPFLARMAALRRSDDHLSALHELHAELEGSVDRFHDFARVNVSWHNAVAAASGNELLATILYSLSHGVESATMVEEYNTAETRRQVLRAHTRIIAAIEARDADAAERGMRLHIVAANARPINLASTDAPLDEVPQPTANRIRRAFRRK